MSDEIKTHFNNVKCRGKCQSSHTKMSKVRQSVWTVLRLKINFFFIFWSFM